MTELAIMLADGVYIGGGFLLFVLIIVVLFIFLRRT